MDAETLYGAARHAFWHQGGTRASRKRRSGEPETVKRIRLPQSLCGAGATTLFCRAGVQVSDLGWPACSSGFETFSASRCRHKLHLGRRRSGPGGPVASRRHHGVHTRQRFSYLSGERERNPRSSALTSLGPTVLDTIYVTRWTATSEPSFQGFFTSPLWAGT